MIFPSSYPHLRQIQQIFNQQVLGDTRVVGMSVLSPQGMYNALLLACQSHQGVCDSTLMNALYQGGMYGTAMTPQEYGAFQRSGQAPAQWLWSHGSQLVWQNSAMVTAAVGGPQFGPTNSVGGPGGILAAMAVTGSVGKLAQQFGFTTREIRSAIESVKQAGLPRGGPLRNPDVVVDENGEVYPLTPGGSPADDSIGNILDFMNYRE